MVREAKKREELEGRKYRTEWLKRKKGRRKV